MADDTTDATLPASGAGASSGMEATLAPESVDATMASGGDAPASSPPVVIRAGRAEDYGELLAVDPRHYVVGKEIARGGMGRILTARDRRLGRPVAIKELLYESGDARARFEREARITAKLQHPAIVNILEAGAWPGGEPFYVMKLVTGESLDKAIGGRATLEARLGLLPNVIAAVDALAYAHSERVIHRDLKPGNVLVGEFGETVVIDWGLAKDLADTTGTPDLPAGPYRREPRAAGETVAGAVMGTPAYMPAEQAIGETVDERADVYALGAMLYHVLAGAPPYTGKTSDDVLEKVIKGPPAKLPANVPPDLVTIVEKSMAHAAADRYPSAKQLADDLKKFQTGQLVGAHRYSTWELVRRWIRRHRTPVAVGAIAAVLLAVLAVVSVQRIVDEQARTEAQRKSAIASRGDAEDLMSFMMTDLRDKLEPLGKLELLDAVAKKSIAYYMAQPGGSDAVEYKRSVALTDIADVLMPEGDLDGALAQHRAALAIRARLVEKDPTSTQWRRDSALSYERVGDVLMDQGDSAGALEAFRTALPLEEALVAAQPTNAVWEHDLAVGHERIADVLLVRGDLPGALAEYRARLGFADTVARQEPANPDWQRDLVFAHHKIGKVLLRQGDAAAALQEHEAGLAVATSLSAADPTNTYLLRDLSVSYNQVGDTRWTQKDLPGALAQYRASLALRERLVARDPANSGWQRDLSISHQNVGDVLAAQDDLAGALAEYRATEAIQEALVAQNPSNARWQGDLAFSRGSAAGVLQRQGDEAGMLAEYQAALTIRQALAVKDPTNENGLINLAWVYDRVGDAQLRTGDVAATLVSFRGSLRARETLAAADPTSVQRKNDLAYSHERMGDALAQRGDVTAAIEEYRAALAIHVSLADTDVATLEKKIATTSKVH